MTHSDGNTRLAWKACEPAAAPLRRSIAGGVGLETSRRYDPKLSDSSISTLWLQPFLTGARAAGVDLDTLFRASGLDPQVCSNPRARIRVDQWARMLQNVILTMDDESVGMYSRPMPVGTFLMICRAFIHCRTIGEAMERYVEFHTLLRYGKAYNLERDGRSVRFTLSFEPGAIKHPVFADFALIGFHRLFSWLGAESIQLDSIGISTPLPAYAAEYRKTFFQTPVQFDQPSHGLTFSRSYLDLPVVRTERDLEGYTARFYSGLFLPIPSAGKFSRNLRAYMVEETERAGVVPELHRVADYFGLHSRALCRRLKNEGVSFQEVKIRVKRDIAIHQLSNTEKSIERIAEHTGFSETSAFIRAFKGWTNMTPLAYRKAMTR